MSTRSNIVIATPDNKAHQFYHHCDGYLSGVGEELRAKLVYSLGMSNLAKDIPLYDILIGEVMKDDQYEDEYKKDMTDHNRLHADIEFLYVIKDSKLYYVNKWDMRHNVDTYKDLIDYVCKDENEIDLTKKCRDKE